MAIPQYQTVEKMLKQTGVNFLPGLWVAKFGFLRSHWRRFARRGSVSIIMATLACTAVYVGQHSVYAVLKLVYASARLDHGLRVGIVYFSKKP